jgi:hypothetical protein
LLSPLLFSNNPYHWILTGDPPEAEDDLPQHWGRLGSGHAPSDSHPLLQRFAISVGEIAISPTTRTQILEFV